MDGREAAALVHVLRPTLPVTGLTGYFSLPAHAAEGQNITLVALKRDLTAQTTPPPDAPLELSGESTRTEHRFRPKGPCPLFVARNGDVLSQLKRRRCRRRTV